MLIRESVLVPIRFVKGIRLVAALALMAAGVALADAPAGDNAAAASGAPAPMSDSAAQGVGCLAAGVPSLGVAYLLGPTEIMMLVTGAVIVPSKSSLLLLALGGILGAGTCSVGAAATPAVLWAANNAGAITSSLAPSPPQTAVKASDAKSASVAPAAVVPMNEGEMQGAGCVVGVVGLGALTLAVAPTEMVMLAAGGVTAASKTSILMMGVLGTIIPASCTIGSAVTLPLVALYQNFDAHAVGQKLASLVGWGHASSSAPGGLQAVRSANPKLGKADVAPTPPVQIGQQDPTYSLFLSPTYYTP